MPAGSPLFKNYMTEHLLLPSEFWFFALHNSVQLGNYTPILTKDSKDLATTPFFQAYGIKPDYRTLFPLFSTSYNGGLDFSLFPDSSVQDMPPAYDLQQSIFLSPTHPDHPSAASTIINIPFSHTSPYSIQITSTKDIVEVMVSDIVPHDPTTIPPDTTNPVLLHPWIQDNSKATLLIPSSMTKPKQGFLLHQPDGEWTFHPGRT